MKYMKNKYILEKQIHIEKNISINIYLKAYLV